MYCAAALPTRRLRGLSSTARSPTQRRGARRCDGGRYQCGDQRRVEGDDDRRRPLRHSLPAERRYRLRVEARGFRAAQAEQVTLRAAQTLTLDFKLDVESVTEAMTVTAPVIETSTAEIGQYVSNKEFQTWPIAVGDGQRQIQQFIFSSLPGTRVERSRARSTAAATTPTRFSSKACRSAATCRVAATTRCRRRPRRSRSSSSRPARSAPSTAVRRRRSRTSSSSRGPTSSTGPARLPMDGTWTRSLSSPRRSTRPHPGGPSRMARWPSGASSCRGCSTDATAASSSPRSKRRAPASRRPRHSGRCPPASSRTATSRACSIPHTPVMPDRARSSALMRSAAPYGSARFTIRGRRASWATASFVIRSPTTRFLARSGMRSRGTRSIRACGTFRSSIACSTTSRSWRPAARCSTRTRSR